MPTYNSPTVQAPPNYSHLGIGTALIIVATMVAILLTLSFALSKLNQRRHKKRRPLVMADD